jgi:3-phenylpropionate/cinnamic acid dioxygenase small subunit
MATESDRALRRLLLRQEIESFFLVEADLLDARRFRDWLALLTEDVRYFMPMARNVPSDRLGAEYTAEGLDANWIDEGIETLTQRVVQLETGVHWAEEPPSRTTHMISNLAVLAVRPADGETQEVDARCRFLVYRNRLETEEYFYVGKRNDTLRRVDGQWRLARREIHLDQNVLLSKNLTVFF